VAYRQSDSNVRHYLLKDSESKDIVTFIRDNSNSLLKFLRLTADDSERAQLTVVTVEEGFKKLGVRKPRKLKKEEPIATEEDDYDAFMMKLTNPNPPSPSHSPENSSPTASSPSDSFCPTCGAKTAKRKHH